MKMGLGLIFIAGLVSFLSPCVLSLLPVYIGLLSGSLEGASIQHQFQLHLFLRTLAFTMGFALVFTLLGLSSTLIGSWMFVSKDWIARVGGIFIVVFGLHTMGLVHIPLLDQEKLLRLKSSGSNSYAGSFFMGIAFSAGWSPCIGPILGSILTAILVSDKSVSGGVIALAVYSAGMAFPFFLISIGIGKGIEVLRNNHKLIHGIQVAGGALMVIMGFLLIFGITTRLGQLGTLLLL